MPVFQVQDMTCGHCASSITKAVRAVDAGATIVVNLDQNLVRIESMAADGAKLAQAIADPGYTPVPVQPLGSTAVTRQARGCCCGGAASRESDARGASRLAMSQAPHLGPRSAMPPPAAASGK